MDPLAERRLIAKAVRSSACPISMLKKSVPCVSPFLRGQLKKRFWANENARGAARQKRADAESLLSSVDDLVVNTLGLSLPANPNLPTSYAVSLRDVIAGRKLYPDYFHPERLRTIRAVSD